MSQHTRILTSAHQKAATAPEFASILIVDDQEFDRTRLKKLCRGFDFNTHVAEADGIESLRDKLRKDRFDLILLDYHLSDGTGLEGVEIIRADKVNCDAATVMITGTEHHEIAIKALKLGFSDYLTKDEITAESLGRAAISALQKSQLARALSAQNQLGTLTNETVQSFSRGCAQDIKPIVSRIMRQMRGLRGFEEIDVKDAVTQIEQVEASLRRLWAFLDDLDLLGGPASAHGPTVPAMRGSDIPATASINARVPSVRPQKPAHPVRKSPSIFRRRPD
ncbi:response regulator [Sulfitobacter guttiformis]|uniref:Response regulator receiver domain-containing protein n=1 Tax=Sulfitobacter guttiformis TaxID=74349 RepID=A0A420DQ03_9RHOB|nr:response regulator [Sulfitobacter guttiformis]KIN73585.1 Response regulator/GGDEF domain protein [Sulfitobacter guttiformis KCTC 32187]RKE96233.1 response regulator receiver domain-containing protein [Sulfitobacter guttiformis]